MLDSVDLKLLKILNENAKTPLREMGRIVGLSTSGVRRRIKHLEKSGAIKGYTTIVDYKKLERGLIAFVSLDVDARSVRELARALAHRPEVCELHRTTGDHGIILKVRARDVDGLNKFIENVVGATDSVKKIQTTVTMETFKETL